LVGRGDPVHESGIWEKGDDAGKDWPSAERGRAPCTMEPTMATLYRFARDWMKARRCAAGKVRY
jgi:hypothetical protein